MENLERFILNNREAFDTEIPDLSVWVAFEKQLNAQTVSTQAKVISLSSWLPKIRLAASVALLVATGISIGFYLKSNTNLPSLADVSPEHAEMEQFYKKEIEKKERLLLQVANNEAPAVKQDLQGIDQVMLELREELMNAPKGSRDHIIKSMIESYKNKVDILERVLQERENYSNTNISKQQSNNEKDTI